MTPMNREFDKSSENKATGLTAIKAENDYSQLAIQAKDIFYRALKAIIVWTAHCLVVAVILIGIRLLNIFIEFLWGEKRLKFFGFINA
ncbi:MAG: hypothetical protein IH628_07480, partial [Proteobacteria bacterium]|nr:hypothetical protein [Pseudomonadota bacterium]